MLFVIFIKEYLSAILIYRLRNNISANEFYLVKIYSTCISISYLAQSIAILRNGRIAFVLIEFFANLYVTAKLSQKI